MKDVTPKGTDYQLDAARVRESDSNPPSSRRLTYSNLGFRLAAASTANDMIQAYRGSGYSFRPAVLEASSAKRDPQFDHMLVGIRLTREGVEHVVHSSTDEP